MSTILSFFKYKFYIVKRAPDKCCGAAVLAGRTKRFARDVRFSPRGVRNPDPCFTDKERRSCAVRGESKEDMNE